MTSLLKAQGAAACLAISGVIMLAVLARVLEPEIFAFYSVAVAYTSAFAKIAGVNVYFFYRHKLALATSAADQLALFRSYAFPVLVTGFVAALVIATTFVSMHEVQWIENPVEVFLLALVALFSLRTLEVIRYYHATARFTFATLAQAAVKLTTVFLVMVGAIYGLSYSRSGLLAILALSMAAVLVAQAIWDPAFFNWRIKAPRYKFQKASIVAGIAMISPVLFGEALVVADRTFLATSTNALTVAQYSLASQGIFLAYGVLGGSLISYFYPHIARAYHSGDNAAARMQSFRLLVAGSAASLTVPIGAWLLHPVVEIFLGSQYARTGELLVTMSLLPLMLFFSSCVVHAFYVLERVSISLWIHGFAVIFHIGATYVLTNAFAVNGAIVALYVSLLLTAVAHVMALFIAARRRS